MISKEEVMEKVHIMVDFIKRIDLPEAMDTYIKEADRLLVDSMTEEEA